MIFRSHRLLAGKYVIGLLFLATVALGALVTAGAETWRSELYPEDWSYFQPEKDFYADKIIQDYSRTGYRGGDLPIPDVDGPVFDVTDSEYGADPSGAEDSTEAIQAALDDAGAGGGGVVYLPPGTYKVAPPAEDAVTALRISHSNVVLRGAGMDKTFILNSSYEMRYKRVIMASGLESMLDAPPQPLVGDTMYYADIGAGVEITRDLTGPTRRIPVADTSDFAVGDRIILRAEMTEAWIKEHNEPGWEGHADDFQVPGFAYPREIMYIDRETDTLLIDNPVRYTMKQRDNSRVHPAGSALTDVGLEDFSIGNVEHPGNGWGQGDYNNEGTAAYDVHSSYIISLRHVENSWVRRVSSFHPEQNQTEAHKLSNGVLLLETRFVTLEDVTMQRVQYGGGGGNGYNFRVINAADNLLTSCLASHNRHGFVFSIMAATGNVFHNCTDQHTGWAASSSVGGSGSDHHMHFSHSNLLDNCLAIDSFYEAVYRPHGSHPQHNITAAHSIFWNTRGEGGGGDVVRSEQARYGYVIGTQGPRDSVNAPSGRQQTDPQDHVEGVGTGESLAPHSLYLDQLQRRLNSVRLYPLGSREAKWPDNNIVIPALAEIGAQLDAYADELVYAWEIVSGPGNPRLENTDGSVPQLIVDRPGDYLVRGAAYPAGEPEAAAPVFIPLTVRPLTTELAADNVASENFEYSDDVGEPLDGLNGGSGWDGAWSAEADGDPGWHIEQPGFGSWPGIFGMEDLPLAFEDGVVARTQRQGSATRDFANVPQATAGSSYRLSVLNLARFDGDANTLSLNLRDSGGNTLVGFDIEDSDQDALDVAIRAGNVTETGSYTPTERGRWIIGQIDYAGGGNGDVHLWVFDGDDLAGISDIESWNPDIGDATLSASVEDGSLDLDFTQFEMLQGPNNNAIRMDRINLKHIPDSDPYTKWADEQDIPEMERDPELDRFGNGVTNLEAFLTGTCPEHPESPRAKMSIDGEGTSVDEPVVTVDFIRSQLGIPESTEIIVVEPDGQTREAQQGEEYDLRQGIEFKLQK